MSVELTTCLVVSLKKGAPGSSSAVRADQAGANISNVVRPSRIAVAGEVIAASVSPIRGSKPKSMVQDGVSKTPSREMNSCTPMVPMGSLSESWSKQAT